jgi:anti-sigma regulatory factor (Ser/Thr protein kinase)
MGTADAGLAIEVPGSKVGLATALEAASSYMDRYGIGSTTAARVALLIEEAVMNVAMHGGSDSLLQASLNVELSLRLLESSVELRLADNGRPFDPRSAPPPKAAASPESAVPGGLGVHFMRRFSSTLDYERADGRNVLTLTVAR